MRRRSGFGWLELVSGILMVVLGLGTFFDPALALSGFVFFYGLVAVVMGIADIILYIQVERYTGLGPVVSLISGILSVMSGIMLIAYPKTGALVLTLIFPIWFIAHCISRLSHLHHIRLTSGDGLYYFTLITNILGLIIGGVMILHPLFTLVSVHYFAGLYLILLGIDAIVLSVSRMGRRL